MTFQQFLLILWARRKIALRIFGATVLTTLVVSLILPKEYTATTSLVVDVKSPDPIAGMIMQGMMTPGYMATQIDIINSDRVASRVVKLLGFEKSAEAVEKWKEASEGKGTLESYYGNILQKKLDIKPSRESNVININFSGAEPQFAAAVANAFAQAYIDTSIEMRVEPARQYSAWFEERQKGLRVNLEKAQARLSSYQQEKGIVVTHTPGVLTDDVADLAMGLVLSIGRRIPQADKFVRNGDWVDDVFALTHKVSGARLGIVGMGRIGRAIAKRAAAFDMAIAYTGRQAKADVPYVFYKTATELAAAVDYLIVAVPGGDNTKNLIGATALQALGVKGYLINIARGSVVDQPVLVQALKDKTIAGAALDVFWDEPIIDPELRRLPNVVLTPHIASATVETRQAMAALTLSNLQAFYERRALPTPVLECQ